MGLTVQNFVSAASGIAVLWCLIRGLTGIKKYGVGNFWQDLVRCTLYILLPICLVSTLVFTQQGVPQTLSGNQYVNLVEPIAADAEGNYLPGAEIDVDSGTVTVDGEIVEDAKIVTKQALPLYPQASQVSMKQLGTNGGGVLGNNSAHPYENPTILTNLIEMMFLLVIAVGLCFSFGRSIAKRGMTKKKSSLADKAIMRRAVRDAFRKLAFKDQIKNPVMFLVYVSAILTSALFLLSLFGISDGIVSSGFGVGYRMVRVE